MTILVVLAACVPVLLVCGGILLALLLPAVQAAREAARRAMCTNNLKQIGLALHNYHDAHGTFPPAFVADKDGKPKHSWRVLILPFMEHKDLYDQYHFDERWDSPHNLELAAKMPVQYRCPSDPTSATTGQTDYVMLVGPPAVSDGPHGRRYSEFAHAGQTIMVVEAAGKGPCWLAPDDLEVAKMSFAIDCPTDPHHPDTNNISSYHPVVANALFCDGSVRPLEKDISSKTLEAMTAIDGGAAVNLDNR